MPESTQTNSDVLWREGRNDAVTFNQVFKSSEAIKLIISGTFILTANGLSFDLLEKKTE